MTQRIKHALMDFKTAYFAAVIFSFVTYVSSSGNVTSSSNVTTVQVNNTAKMEWNVVSGDNQRISALELFRPGVIEPLIFGVLPPVVQPNGKTLFGERITATFNAAGQKKYIIEIRNIEYKDGITFRLRATFRKKPDDSLDGESHYVIRLNVIEPPTPTTSPPVEPTPTGKGKGKGGIIAGAVIGGIAFVVLIVVGVVLFLRWKKNHPSKTDASEQMKSLKANKPAEEGVHYASTDVTVPPEKRDQQVYAQVDRSGGGGRDGPKPEVVKSDYAQMHVDADGYPASGPTSSTPPDENEDGISSGVVV